MDRTRTYECMCLLDNREVRKGWESLKSDVNAIFAKHNAKVLSSRRWDERRLAYPIKGQVRATYLLIYIEIDTKEIPLLRRDLQFADSLLRYMITDCPNVPEGAYEPEEEFDVNDIPEDDAPEAPAEEEKAEGGGEKADGEKAEGEAADGEKADGEAADGEKAEGEESKTEEASTEGEAAPAGAGDSEEKK